MYSTSVSLLKDFTSRALKLALSFVLIASLSPAAAWAQASESSNADISRGLTTGIEVAPAEGGATAGAVANMRGGTYDSVKSAIAAAQAGDTLYLTADVSESEAVSIDKNITLNLMGKTWSLSVTDTMNASAISVGDGASLTIKDDSSTKGSASITVGPKALETRQSLVYYAGIQCAGSGSFSLQEAQLQVMYSGKASGTREVALYAVYLEGAASSVAVSRSSELRAVASAADDAFGAEYAYGIYAGASVAGDHITVDSSSSVVSTNNSLMQSAGEVSNQYTDNDATLNTTNDGMRRIQPDENSELYQEILTKFREKAKLDTSAGSDGYASRCYYVNGMSLSDGSLVWAVSNTVAKGEETLDNIKPEVILVQSTYNLAPQAIAVGAADGSSVSATLEGQLSASSSNGEACAVEAYGSGSWSLKATALSAHGGSGKFAQKASKEIDLHDLGLSSAVEITDNWFYPKKKHGYLVNDVPLESCALKGGEGTTINLSGSTSFEVEGAQAIDIIATKVQVDSAFVARIDDALTFGSLTGANTVGNEFMASSDGTELSRSLVVDAYSGLTVGAKNGALVWDEPYTVTFCSDRGVVSTQEALMYGDTVAVPDAADMKKDSNAAFTYVFLGWSTNSKATKADIDASETTLNATSSATYYAVYETVATSIQVTFTGAYSSSGAQLPDATFVTGYGQTLAQASVKGTIPTAQDYVKDGKTYRFVGWDASRTLTVDPTSVESELSFDINIATAKTGVVTLTAKYIPVESDEYLVTFKYDDFIRAYAAKAGSAPSFKAAGASEETQDKIVEETGYSYTWTGWYTGRLSRVAAEGKTPDYESTSKLPKVNSDVFYTACYRKTKALYSIKFVYWHWYEDANDSSNSGYKYYASAVHNVEYGSNNIEIANSYATIGSTVAVDGYVYTLKGWSVREDDVDPLYTDYVPYGSKSAFDSGTDSTSYYAIYGKVEQEISVSFHDGSELYGSAQCKGSATVSDALAAAGKTSPVDKSASEVFKGWATSSDAESADALSSTTLSSLVKSGSSLDLYAVYGEAYKPTVTFVASDQTTVLASMTVEAGAVLPYYSVPTPSAIEGKFFKGWVLANGQSFSCTSAVTNDVRVFASYGDIVTNALSDDPETGVTGSANVAKASYVDNNVTGATSVVFTLVNANGVDSTIETQASVNGDALIGNAAYAAFYSIDNQKNNAVENIGSVTVTLSCGSAHSGSKVRVYWKKADGSVAYTSALDQNNGYVTVTLSSYSALNNLGNVAVAEVGTGSSGLSGSTLSGGNASSGSTLANTSGTTKSSSTLRNSGTSSSPSTANTSSTSGLAGSETTSAVNDIKALSEADGGIANDVPDAELATDIQAAMQQISGNPVVWAVTLLLLAGIGSGAWYMLLGRKRQTEGVDDEEAGWSDGDDDGPSERVPAAAASSSTSASSDNGGITF